MYWLNTDYLHTIYTQVSTELKVYTLVDKFEMRCE